MTRGEMLLHVATHAAGHRGQVALLLQKNGIQPFPDRITDFLKAGQITEVGRRHDKAIVAGAFPAPSRPRRPGRGAARVHRHGMVRRLCRTQRRRRQRRTARLALQLQRELDELGEAPGRRRGGDLHRRRDHADPGTAGRTAARSRCARANTRSTRAASGTRRISPATPRPCSSRPAWDGAPSRADQARACERHHSSKPIRPRRASPNGTSERSSTRPP